MFCILAFPLVVGGGGGGGGGGGSIRNMNILLADILLIFILYISLYKGVPPAPRPHRPGPLISVMKGFCRLTSIFQAY